MRRVLVILMIILTVCSTSFAKSIEETDYHYKNEETGYCIVINDEVSLLDKEEVGMLADDMYSLTEYGNIVFLSTNYAGKSQHQIAHDFYYSLFGTQSGTVLLIDMYDRVVYIYSDGDNLSKVTSSKAEIVTDNIYKYLSNQNYYEGSKKAYSQIRSLLEGQKIAEPMKYISNALIAILLGFSITFIIALKSTQMASATTDDIVKKAKVKFNNKGSRADKIGERRVYSPRTESSSSGGGRSSGGSFHSSGGGGGHRF